MTACSWCGHEPHTDLRCRRKIVRAVVRTRFDPPTTAKTATETVPCPCARPYEKRPT